MTLNQAAAACGLSPSFLSQLERDQTGVMPATLHRLVHAYGATFSAVTRRERPGLVQLQQRGKRRKVGMHGVEVEQLVDGETLMDAEISTIAVGSPSAGVYSHDGEELVYVLDGVLDIALGNGERHLLKQGDSIYHPSTIEHEWRNAGDVPLRLLWVCTPPTF
jgi:quercetin dioxygenase-like cupin family protein